MNMNSMIFRAYIESIKREDATHTLDCRLVMGWTTIDYCMDCIILKEMPNDRLKILVFGERRRRDCDDKKQIRYVDKFRVKTIKETSPND